MVLAAYSASGPVTSKVSTPVVASTFEASGPPPSAPPKTSKTTCCALVSPPALSNQMPMLETVPVAWATKLLA